MGSAADCDLLHDRHPVHGGSWQDLWYPPLHHLLKGQAGLFLHCLVTVFQLELAHISGLLKRKDLKQRKGIFQAVQHRIEFIFSFHEDLAVCFSGAIALEIRGFEAGQKKTYLREGKMKTSDRMLCLVMAVVIAGAIVVRIVF